MNTKKPGAVGSYLYAQDPTKLQIELCTLPARNELRVNLRIEQWGLCKNNAVAKGLVSLILQRKEDCTAQEHGQYGSGTLITARVKLHVSRRPPCKA